ncbi:hypothetical protein [Myroides odoratimimus]|uniref:GLPGLI family protein n=1 Tax=Myroides odoratimimus CCUG 10230 TaxID=883150 RepID=A0ABP2NAX3_9FLAO|nr:hypothetical protein [Myroides odoratimimus]EHO09363.1 hypothetical protein HMPREF9712_01870 [Myroides odoratimimus CCUG 10230]MDM1085907.1 hypothetical protein [Myroides odoratimimus]MDM1458054.1 hypothetical protein [Myroides odoratimimus]MEC4086687.1 hypothetical protein [Myroides odoratimimus]STZ49558.1 Uncharacterised protein [Myroides odoratimimus]
MKNLYLYLLLLIGMPWVYGQAVLSKPSFASSASIVYLNSNPRMYLEDSQVRFFTSFRAKHTSAKTNRYEEKYELEELMYNKYRLLNRNIKFNNGVAVDVSPDKGYVREYDQDLTFLQNLFLDFLIGILP